MKPRDKLRQNIQDTRVDKHMTQREVAEKLNISEAAYSKIERGATQVSVERLIQIANVFEVSPADLIPFGEDSLVSFSNEGDNVSNSGNVTLAIGNPALEAEISALKQMIDAKNEIIASREEIIGSLKQQIETLQDLVNALKNK